MISAVTNVSMNSEQTYKLYTKHKNLVYWICSKYIKSFHLYIDEQDIISAGFLGLTKAIRTYNNQQSKFTTWATYIIKQHILIEIRKAQACHRIPRTKLVSMDNSVIQADGSLTSIGDIIPDSRNDIHQCECDIDIELFKKRLTSREAEILNYILDNSRQADIAEHFNTTQPAISRIIKKIRNKFKEFYYE